jgi:IS1 family transposase
MNCLPRETRLLILKLICRHNGINDIADITGCMPNTVMAQLARMGEAAAAIHDRLVCGARPARLELDELWSYCYCKRESRLRKRDRNTDLGPRKRHPPLDRGERYTWVALDPDSKAALSFFTGDRGAESAHAFLTDLHYRVMSRPLITTDGHLAYREAIQRTFGADADHVVLEKELRSWFNRETGEKTTALVKLEKVLQSQSGIDVGPASTSHIERMNATIRNFDSRFTRQTYRFSKKLENHAHAFAIMITYYNFVRAHYGFRGTEWKGCSPAMKAGLSDRVWSYEDFLDEIDAYWRLKVVSETLSLPAPVVEQYEPLAAGNWTDLPFLVSHSRFHRTAKVHAAHCRDCRRAAGGRKEGPKANFWYAFSSEGEALKCAETLAPWNFGVCSICILGHYPGNVVTGRGPDGRKTVTREYERTDLFFACSIVTILN